MNILGKVIYVVLITSIARWKYYTAWILADAICNASGLGFNGHTPQGVEKWDLISNVDIIPVEVSLLSSLFHFAFCLPVVSVWILWAFLLAEDFIYLLPIIVLKSSRFSIVGEDASFS